MIADSFKYHSINRTDCLAEWVLQSPQSEVYVFAVLMLGSAYVCASSFLCVNS